MKWMYAFCTLFILGCERMDDVGVLVPPTVDQDPHLPGLSIHIAGHQRLIHLITFGRSDNPPLFFLHGSYTDMYPYENLCESLSDNYFVVVWDQRGCGLSERITEAEFTLETAVEEIDAVKEVYAPHRKITLLGHSWGGGLATLYTSKNPENVEQLVLIEPMPLIGFDMQKLFKTIVNFRYDNGSWNNMARHGLALRPQTHEQLDYQALMILRSTMTANYHCDGNNPPTWQVHRVGGFIEYVRNKRLGNPISGFKYDFTDGIKNFSDTVLILGGSCSSLGAHMQRTYSQPHFRCAKVIEIQDAGHRMNVEKFEEVMHAIKAFLKAY